MISATTRAGGIGDWITRRAARRPAATALVEGSTGTRISYADLEARTNQMARGLASRGIAPGDRVALLMDNSVAFLQLLFAVAKLGAITVPINVRLAGEEVAYVLTDSGATVLAHSDRLTDVAHSALQPEDHQVEHVFDGAESIAALGTEESGDAVGSDIDPDEVCVIMYTSGTTGRPKGAMLTHDNMLWNAINMLTAGPGLSGTDTTVAAAPLFHIGALGLSALPLLYAGGTVVVQEAFDPIQTAELMARERVTTQFLVPAMWAAMTRVPQLADYDMSALRWAISGGAPCPIPVIEFFQGLGWTFTEGFGMTELSPAALFLDSDEVLTHAGSVGRPFMHVDIRLVDDTDSDVATGEVGELLLRGPTVFTGYWQRPNDTAEALRGGWFHSGDLGVADSDGFITLVDRKKDMIISGGENIYPIEVEQVLHQHPDVADVAVIGIGDLDWGETVCAVVVTEGETAPTADELISYTRRRIAHFKCPRRIEFTDQLPRNATGKLLKRVLRAELTGDESTITRS